MQTIDQAFQEICKLHEKLVQSPVPEIGPQAFLPFPPGVNPMAYAIEEVAQLKRMFEGAQQAQASATQPHPQQPHQHQHQQQITWVPRANVHASETTLVFHVELPGVAKDDVNVTVAAGELIVRGVRKAPVTDATMKPMFVEQAWGAFERRFPCPPWCDPEKIHARYSQGVLEIQLTRLDELNRGEFRVEIGS